MNPRRAYDSNRQEIPPMTLGGMRALGVRSIAAWCEAIGCDTRRPSMSTACPTTFRCRMSPCVRCPCGGRDIRTRPDWREMHAARMPPPRQ